MSADPGMSADARILVDLDLGPAHLSNYACLLARAWPDLDIGHAHMSNYESNKSDS